MSNLLYMDGGGAGSNLSILKEAKKIIWAGSFFPGGRGPFAYSYGNLYILWFSMSGVSVEPTPLDDTVFVAIPWLMAIPWL